MDITRGDDMAFDKIETSDLVGVGVIGLPDTPQLSTSEMQEKFEETGRDVIIPHFNKLIDNLASEEGAGELGAQVPEEFSAEDNMQAIIDAFALAILNRQVKEPGKGLSTYDYSADEMEKVAGNTAARHTHSNKTILDAFTSLVKQGYDRLVGVFETITSVSDEVEDSPASLPTGRAVVEYVQENGGGGGGGSGIIAPVNGFFTMYVTATGDLYVRTIDDAEMPPFRYDANTGNLYWDAP